MKKLLVSLLAIAVFSCSVCATITNENRKISYVVDATSEFTYAYTFDIVSAGDIYITFYDTDGVEVEFAMVRTTSSTPAANEYYVDETNSNVVIGDDGSATLQDKYGATITQLLITRTVDFTQESAFPTATSLQSTAIENALDKNTMISQQLSETQARTLRLPPQDPASQSPVLPAVAVRAGKALGFDASGNVTVTDSAGTFTTTNAFWDDIQVKGPYIDVRAYGAVGDGVTDDGPAFNAALTAGRAGKKPVCVPYAQYLIDEELNCFKVSMIGFPSSGDNDSGIYSDTEYPTLIGGASITTGVIRVGQLTNSTDIEDRSTLMNFTIDMQNMANSTKGVFCLYGVLHKTIKNFWIRSDETTRANIITADKTGFHFAIATTADQGLYYLTLDNLNAFRLYRGFYTSGDTLDGMRECNIGRLAVWEGVQSFTFKDTRYNNIGILGLNSIITGYDPSGATPTDWGIWMENEYNHIGLIAVESISDATAPHTFITGGHTIGMYRQLDIVPSSIQFIDETSDARYSGSESNKGPGRALIASNTLTEVGTVAGVQVQESLTSNPYFQMWSDPSGGNVADVADAETFSYTWTAVKGGTGTLGLDQATSNTNSMLHDSSVMLDVTTPQADKHYGIKQDLAAHFTLNGTVLTSIGGPMEYVTVAVRVKPKAGNAGNTKFRIAWDQGTGSGNEDYIINYTPTTAGVDEKIFGQTGSWWTLIHQINALSNATKFEITVGLYPADTVTVGCYIDSVMVIAGRHTQYGAQPYLRTPRLFQPAVVNANVNAAPGGNTVQALPVFDKDGAIVGYIPVFAAEW